MFKKVSLAIAAVVASTSAFALNLPDTPVPFKLGVGSVVGQELYIGLGTAGTSFYKIDLKSKSPAWSKVAEFPGPARDQSQAVVLNGKLYVFGGVGKPSSDATLTVFNDVYSYDPKTDKWTKEMTRSPLGLTGHTVVTRDGKNAIVVGSVNKAIFDGYFEDMEATKNDQALNKKAGDDYISKPVQDYFFNDNVLAYDAANNLWKNMGRLSTTGLAGAAVAVNDKNPNEIVVVGGERKPGLRTEKGTLITFDKNGNAKMKPLAPMVPPTGQKVQDGVAGAFAGSLAGQIIVAGGANFPGASTAYDKQGKTFAHQGLTKTWRDEIYLYNKGKWSVAGKLPSPLGYGVMVPYGNELLIVGGETTGGNPTSKVITLTVKNGKVTAK